MTPRAGPNPAPGCILKADCHLMQPTTAVLVLVVGVTIFGRYKQATAGPAWVHHSAARVEKHGRVVLVRPEPAALDVSGLMGHCCPNRSLQGTGPSQPARYSWAQPATMAPCLSRKPRLESYGRETPTLLLSKAASSMSRAMKRWWEFGFCQDRRGRPRRRQAAIGRGSVIRPRGASSGGGRSIVWNGNLRN